MVLYCSSVNKEVFVMFSRNSGKDLICTHPALDCSSPLYQALFVGPSFSDWSETRFVKRSCPSVIKKEKVKQINEMHNSAFPVGLQSIIRVGLQSVSRSRWLKVANDWGWFFLTSHRVVPLSVPRGQKALRGECPVVCILCSSMWILNFYVFIHLFLCQTGPLLCSYFD